MTVSPIWQYRRNRHHQRWEDFPRNTVGYEKFKNRGGRLPAVAIVTRTHNRELLLKRAIASVGAQTFTDYVHIIVNDRGDRDTIQALLESVPTQQRERSEVINLGPGDVTGREGVVNPGFARAQQLQATYTVVLDDDDSWQPEFLETTVGELHQHPTAVAAATQSNVIYETVDVENHTVTEVSRELLAADKTALNLEDTLIENFVPPVALLFRTETLETLRGWDSTLPVLADWDFTLRLLLLGEVRYLAQPLANWHHRQNLSGDLGNSIVVAAREHHDFHAIIRNNYLRQANHANPATLGLALLMAHYKEELQREQREIEAAQAHHLEMVKDAQIQLLESQMAQYQGLQAETNQNLSNQINEATELLKALHQRLDNRSVKTWIARLLGRRPGTARPSAEPNTQTDSSDKDEA